MNLIQPHDTWSIFDSSKVKQYLMCPRQYFYRYILGWTPDTTNQHLIFGESIHNALAHIVEHLQELGDNKVISEAYDLFEATYREKIPEHDDELYNPKTPEHALVALAQYTQHWKNDPIDYEPVYTEVSGKVSIGTAIMSFRIDAVLRHRKPGFDKFLILEHKTTGASFSSQWQDEWQLDIQPATYLHAANCWFGPENVDCLLINGLCFLKTKKDFIRVPIQKTRGQMLVWLKTVQDAIGDINYQTSLLTEECKPEDYILEAFPLNPTNCRRFYMCSYHNFCMAWDNPLRVIAESNNEPPPGMKTDWWNPLEKPSNLVVDLEGVDIATQ